MSETVLVLTVLLTSGMIALLVHLARSQRLTERSVLGLTAVCTIALVVMLISDWPSEILADFWAEHSVLAGLLSSVLLVAVVFLAFEDNERRKQEQIDGTVTSTGLGGIVDHMVDVEVALSLVGAAAPPDSQIWPGWDNPNLKPLRWLRHERTRLHRDPDAGGAGLEDPRRLAPALADHADVGAPWRDLLVDQCVRRLLAAIRDWSPVIQNSRNGTLMLVTLSELRRDLMHLDVALTPHTRAEAEELLGQLRFRCRVLAQFFERLSGVRNPRPEVLLDGLPLASVREHAWTLDAKKRRALSSEWQRELGRVLADVTKGA